MKIPRMDGKNPKGETHRKILAHNGVASAVLDSDGQIDTEGRSEFDTEVVTRSVTGASDASRGNCL